jgi:hypothetical protein
LVDSFIPAKQLAGKLSGRSSLENYPFVDDFPI